MLSDHIPVIGLFGAAPDTPNMGVSALYRSFVSAMRERISTFQLVAFDNGLGLRKDVFHDEAGPMDILRFGIRGGHRYYYSGNLATLAALSTTPLRAVTTEGTRVIDSCDVILDVSGGDSFSDLYGKKFFNTTVRPKIIANRRGKKLILLPQTYGPFRRKRSHDIAQCVVSTADAAWARDSRSFEVLKALLGRKFDPGVHQCGVDMAFGLKPAAPDLATQHQLSAWLEAANLRVGINVNGLVWHTMGKDRFGLNFLTDYQELLLKLVRWILSETDANILLVPHVYSPSSSYESDQEAIAQLVRSLELPGTTLRRVFSVDASPDEQQLKWLVSKCDWFCGSRMHSTIAGLSSCVPTAAIAYSDKTLGVFETCLQGGHVVDPRHETTDHCLMQLKSLFMKRHETRQSLYEAIPHVEIKYRDQMRKIARSVIGE
jgi:colanic acid/amylovoran biosynthesis protein